MPAAAPVRRRHRRAGYVPISLDLPPGLYAKAKTKAAKCGVPFRVVVHELLVDWVRSSALLPVRRIQ